MSYIRIWVHCVWATKNRSPVMDGEMRSELFGRIREYSLQNGIFIDRINGGNEHVHLLLSLGASQSISDVVGKLKGASAHWINRSGIRSFRFAWQDSYFAVSVSESQVDKVRRYIDLQEEHHRKRSFTEEYQEFIELHGFTMMEDGTAMEKL